MAISKTATGQNVLTVTLSDEQYELLSAFALEHEIEDLGQALAAALDEVVHLHDQEWDRQFASSTALLNAKAKQALEDDRAGLTEDFDN